MENDNKKLTTLGVSTNKPAVEIRRAMIGNPVVMAALEPVERAVFLASTAQTFAEYNPVELAADMKKALTWISKDVGYKAMEADLQYIVIRSGEIMKRYYPTLTMKDFRMAFEMCVTGALDDYLPKDSAGNPDRKHYQQFNAEYICKILNAYKSRRAAVLKKAFKAVESPELKPGEDVKGRYRKEIVKDLFAAFDAYRETGILSISPIAELVYYNILSEYGLAVPVEVTEDEQKRIWQRTVNDYARRGMIGDVNRLKQSGTSDPELAQGAFALARRRALKTAFGRIIEQGKTIQDFIR